MQITFYSIMMALIWSALISIGILFFRKHVQTIPYFSVHSLILLYALCVFRMCFPMEFSFTKVVNAPILYNWCVPFLYHKFDLIPITPLHILAMMWGIVSAILLFKLGKTYRSTYLILKQLLSARNPKIECVYSQLFPQHAKQADIICHSIFKVPMQIGFFHPVILMPDQEFNMDDLRSILQHEMMHYRNHDTIIKLCINIWSCIFWWFPFTYVIGPQIMETLELNCDYELTKHMTDKEKSIYLSSLLHVYLQKDTSQNSILSGTAVAFCKTNDAQNILRRFQYINNSQKKHIFSIPMMLFVFLTFIGSYGIILQGHFEPIYENDSALYFSNENAFILCTQNHEYQLYVDDNYIMPITKNQVEKLEELGMTILYARQTTSQHFSTKTYNLKNTQ